MRLFRKKKSTIGLDIGTSMIKAVKITRVGEEYTLDSFALESIDEGVIQSGEIKDPSSLAHSAKSAVEKCSPNAKDVIVALPNYAILSEVLNMKLTSDKEIRQAVLVEAERLSPFDMSEVELDYSVLERDEEKQEMTVLMVAAKNDIILSHIDFLSEAGLRPVIIDVDLFALTNVFHVNYQSDKYNSSIIINIGSDNTVAAFLQNGKYHSSRDIPAYGRLFIEKIVNLPDMNVGNAHSVMQGVVPPELDARMIAKALNSAATEFAKAVGVALSYFQASDNVENVDVIALTGGYACIPGLINVLELRTGAEVIILDPFTKISYSEELMAGQNPEKLGTLLSVAIGLATRET